MEFGNEGLSRGRLQSAVDAARECGFAAVSANDHFVFSTPWLDGPTALAAIVERSGDMALATTLSLAVLRGPVPLAKTLAALDILSDGRLIAGLGPGSSKRDYDALGVPFEERWKRLDEAITMLRALLRGDAPVDGGGYFAAPETRLSPPPQQAGGIPLWIGSWGSQAGLRRVARLGDGWLASAYNTTPERFSAAKEFLGRELEAQGKPTADFPNALVTMWTWVTERRREAERVLTDVLAPLLTRDPAELRGQVCVGSAEM
ncbi:MAG: LLM class flavin-dependent oxidoreductase, partial [Actinomycetota bacterium]